MKRMIKRISILTFALIVSISALSACSSTETTANNKADSGAAHSNLAANDKEKPSHKAEENKAAETAQDKTIELFDGRSGKVKNAKLSEVDLALVEADVRKKAKEDFLKNQIIGSDFSWKEEFLILDVAEGAFTEPDSIQRAVLYRFSYTNGVVILADGDIIAHYSGGPGDYAFYTAIKSLPDVNQNGLSEIILFRNVEDNEDIIPYLFEAKDNTIKFLGEANYFDSGYIGGEDTNLEKTKQNAYRLTVQPSKNPTYLQETYERTGNKSNWKLTKKAEKFSWETRDDDVYNLTKID